MSEADTLRALASRCEAMTGPDGETDGRIACAVRGWRFVIHSMDLGTHYCIPGQFSLAAQYTRPPAYTASLDAALTLVPKGWTWEVHQGGRAEVCNHLSDDMAHGVAEECAAPALALCAAALRARAAEVEART